MIVAGSQVSISPETKTKAESDAGRIIDQAIRDQMHDLETSQTVGGLFSQFMAEFESVIRECLTEDWDGNGSIGLNAATIDAARRFANVVPLGVRKPSVGAEPDGHITFEWHTSPEKTLSVSIDEWANLHYSALLGPDRHYGTESFVCNVPARLLDLIYQVVT
jgi:hypothetical protein